jgi:hypothetical protein
MLRGDDLEVRVAQRVRQTGQDDTRVLVGFGLQEVAPETIRLRTPCCVETLRFRITRLDGRAHLIKGIEMLPVFRFMTAVFPDCCGLFRTL